MSRRLRRGGRHCGGPETPVNRKYLLDDLYLRGIVRPIQYPLARDMDTFDRRVIDGAVNGSGTATRALGSALRYLQSGSVQRYAAILVAGVIILVFVVART